MRKKCGNVSAVPKGHALVTTEKIKVEEFEMKYSAYTACHSNIGSVDQM